MTPFDSRTRDKAAEVAEERASAIDDNIEALKELPSTAPRRMLIGELDRGRLDCREIAAAIRALPAASQGGWMVPEGYKLVPVEPTPEMVESAVTCSRADVSYFDAEETYRAMLEAAPPPPSQDGDAGGSG